MGSFRWSTENAHVCLLLHGKRGPLFNLLVLQLLDGAPAMHPPPSPASSALQKLKNISFSPKKKSAAAAQSALLASPDRARRALTAAAASASPERQPVKVKPEAGPKKK